MLGGGGGGGDGGGGVLLRWKNAYRELANTKPLFLSIYATVALGIIFSSFYVFSAIHSAPSSAGSTAWLSSPTSPSLPSLRRLDVVSPYVDRSRNFSQGTALSSAASPLSNPQPSDDSSTKPVWEVPPENSQMPPLETFRLTKELVQQRAKDNVIIVTFGNYAFMDFILTWVKHLTDLEISNLLVGAMDTKLLEALYWQGVPVFDMESHMSTVDVGWGSPTFHKMGREKVILIDSILPFGVELLMCDTDMVWFKNPLPYLARYPEADVLTSSDQVVPTVTDDRLEIWQQVGAAFNIGIFHWRPTAPAIKLAKEWKELLLADDKIWDQNGFNDIVRKQLGPSVNGNDGLTYAFDGSLKLGILPASIFCSGHTYFVQAMHLQLRLEPYAVHTTFQYAGTEGKRHRLREAMAFYDPADYYDAPGGFLSFKPSIPKSLLLEGEHNLQSHFALVNFQIKHIRTALAIASLLNRTLVMPPLWCRLDRLWFAHPGILEGTLTKQPFICPLDHVFEVNVMLKELPEEEFGPGINIREYSFFENPSLPKKFTSTFASFKDVKVIQFSSMQNKREEKYRNRVKRYVGIWCCVDSHNPGHIYYDMYWDEKPNWKPIPPQLPEDDHPNW
ncbi:Arabinosyltransferase XEG113 [Linum perenne]